LTGTGDASTGDPSSTTGGTTTTTGEPPVGKALSEVCNADDECESGACVGSN
jgi:hypothetical protein